MLEDVRDKVKTVLQTYLPAQLDVIDTARGGGIVLDDIASFHTTEFALDDFLQLPALLILAVRTNLEHLLRSSANYRDTTHTLNVIIIVSEVQNETLETRLLRYAQAVEQVLVTHNTLDDVSDLIIDTNVLRYGIGEVKRFSTSQTFVQGMGIVVEVKERYTIT